MKKLIAALTLALMFNCSIVYANEINISVNDMKVDFKGDLPYKDENGEIHAPLRELAESLGETVDWEDETKSVKIGKHTTYKIGEDATIRNSKSYVNLKELARRLGHKVETEDTNVKIIMEYRGDNLFDYMPKDRNYVVSPYSLNMALAVAANGAQGNTESEITKLLGVENLMQFNEKSKQFISESSKNEQVKINISNSVWNNKDYGIENLEFSAEFIGLIDEYYNGIAQVIGNNDGANAINNWVSAETMGKINNIVTDEQVEETLSFIINTVYFKGDWLKPFNAIDTVPGKFTDRNEESHVIQFMKETSIYDYYEGYDIKVLAKPYVDENIKMYFILDQDSTFTQEKFENAIKNMTKTEVDLKIPKFKIESSHEDLVSILNLMGVKEAFSPIGADFSKMYTEECYNSMTNKPYISNIIQKAVIELDEEGTEAAAVTEIFMVNTSASISERTSFHCDVPFTYVLRNDVTGDILFMGEYAFVE